MKPFRVVLNVCELYNFLGENGLVPPLFYHDFFLFVSRKSNRKTAVVWENSSSQLPPKSTCGLSQFHPWHKNTL